MLDGIIAVILVVIIGSAAVYVYRAKKRGVKCIGCPDSGRCSGNCQGCCGCGRSE